MNRKKSEVRMWQPRAQGLIFADAVENAQRGRQAAKPAVRKGGKSTVSDEDSDFSD